jgi:hypothetical protein
MIFSIQVLRSSRLDEIQKFSRKNDIKFPLFQIPSYQRFKEKCDDHKKQINVIQQQQNQYSQKLDEIFGRNNNRRSN